MSGVTGIGLADAALNGPEARSAYGVSGTGIRIGILSDSYDVNGGAAAAIAQGLLPANGVTVLEEGPAGSSDEGQALAELIHQTAPGAQLYFYTAYNSETDFANGITALANAGCNIIVDDVAYEDEPFFQIAGPIDAAVQQVLARGVDYFSAAGNEGANFYQGAFTPVSVDIPDLGARTVAQFPDGGTTQLVTVPAGFATTLSLQWSAPYQAANPAVLTIDAVAPDGAVIHSFQSNKEPTALLALPVSGVQQTYRIYIAQSPGTAAPAQFKEVLEGAGTLSGAGVGVGSGSIIGHDLIPGVNAVGAVNVAETPAWGGTPTPESYSSTGPGELLYAADGTPLVQPQKLNAPDFLAPDGANTSVFAPFDGTSPAAGEAAAVAALMLQADPSLSNGDVTTLLDDSALPAGAASLAGAGLIQANLAVGFAATGTIANAARPVLNGIGQACTLAAAASGAQMLVAGSGPALLQAPGNGDTIMAGSGADTAALTGASALLFGSSGPLVVSALDGADTVAGGAGAVTVLGGSGGGIVFGGAAGNNLLVAGRAATTLVQGGGGDTLIGGAGGNDALFAAGTGTATLLGAGGNAAGDAFLATGSGADLIVTGSGINGVWLGAGAASVVGGAGPVDLTGGAGTAVVFGSPGGNDTLRAGSGETTLVATGAADTLCGQGAGDVLVAAAQGEDTLLAGAGRETLVGGSAGFNFLGAGGADAVIVPEAADAVLALGAGQSTVVLGSGAATVSATDGQAGGDAFITGFDPAKDILDLIGYGSGAATALASQYDGGGNSWITLPDGTVLAFLGVGHLGTGNVMA